eukprot:5384854-Pyramimonas_sp.AAC.1
MAVGENAHGRRAHAQRLQQRVELRPQDALDPLRTREGPVAHVVHVVLAVVFELGEAPSSSSQWCVVAELQRAVH